MDTVHSIWKPLDSKVEIRYWRIHNKLNPRKDFFTNALSPGTPGLPVIMVNVTEVEPSRYKIVWTTPSFTNLAEHLLIYKQVKVIDMR